MHDQRAQRQLLLAAFGTGAHHAFEAFEQRSSRQRESPVEKCGGAEGLGHNPVLGSKRVPVHGEMSEWLKAHAWKLNGGALSKIQQDVLKDI